MATYTVQKGDTLWALAKKYGTSIDAIAKSNNISNPNLIYTGQTLNIGTPAQTSNTTTNVTNTTANNTNTKTNTTTNSANTVLGTSAANGTYGYKQSQAVTDAYNTYQSLMNNKPEAYQSKYQSQIDALLAEINGSKFSYDANADALYQQYAQRYQAAGNQAMRDTVAEASALSGGYGNSYATTAGAQAYNAYLENMSNVLPSLYNSAYSIYSDDLNRKQNTLANYQSLEDADYNKYLQEYNNYNNELNTAYNNYNMLYGNEYNEYLNDLQNKQALETARLAAESSKNSSSSSKSSEYKAGSSAQYKISSARAQNLLDGGSSASDIMDALYKDYQAGNITAEELEMIYYADLGLSDKDMNTKSTNLSDAALKSINNFNTGTSMPGLLSTSMNTALKKYNTDVLSSITKRSHSGGSRSF